MTEEDNKLVTQFMAAQRTDVPDKGFSRRVMRRLPTREQRFSRLWTAFCIACFAVLFIVFHGWTSIEENIAQLQRALSPAALHQTISWTKVGYVAFSVLLLTVIGLRKVSKMV